MISFGTVIDPYWDLSLSACEIDSDIWPVQEVHLLNNSEYRSQTLYVEIPITANGWLMVDTDQVSRYHVETNDNAVDDRRN